MSSEPTRVATVAACSNETPIVVTTAESHGLSDGAEVKIEGVLGQDAANGAFFIRRVGDRDLALFRDQNLTTPVQSSGAHTGGGIVSLPLPEDHALVVGLNRYPAFKTLRGAEGDAVRFYDWLISPSGGMVAIRNVQRILSSDFPDADPNDVATWRPPLEALKLEFRRHSDRAFANKAKTGSSRVGRRLYVFLAGHGITPARAASPNLEDAALLMASASAQAYGEHLLGYSWAEWFVNAAAFDEVLLFMDCCRDVKNNVPPIPCSLTPLLDDRRADVKVFGAAATELDSQSWEQDFGTPAQPYGVFSYVLMQGLQSDALRGEAGELTGTRLASFLDDELPKLRADQRPRLKSDITRDVVIIRRPSRRAANVEIAFSPAMTGQDVHLFASENLTTPIQSFRVNGAAWQLHLARGLYKLVAPGGRPPRLFEVSGSTEVVHVDYP
jgi:hypothetical protein